MVAVRIALPHISISSNEPVILVSLSPEKIEAIRKARSRRFAWRLPLFEAYTAGAWDVGVSHEMMNLRERRLSLWSNATCAMLLCEALSSRRGQEPHHAQKDRIGTWDISRLVVSCSRRRSVSRKRGAVADDARAREVGLRDSSCEAGEQSGATRCGAGGAKGGCQGGAALAHRRWTACGKHLPLDPRWEPYAGRLQVRICAGSAR